MTPKKIPFNYDINRMEAVDLVSIIHIDDYDTRFLELILSNEGSPLNVDGCTVAARFVTAHDKYLLRDDVPCEAVANTITIPIDAAAVDNMACDIKIEVNIVDSDKILTLPFPLWIRVRGSILDDAQVTPESEGTIPDLLKAAQQALDAATAAIEAASDYENMDNKPQINGVELVGDQTASDLGLQDKLTAGTNITIDENNEISAQGGSNNYNDLTNKPQINGVIVDGSKSNQDFGFSNFYYSPDNPPLYQSSSVNYQIHDIWIKTSPTTTAKTFSTETPYILRNIWNQNTLIWEPLRVTVHISDDPYISTPPEYEIESSRVLKYHVGDLWMARRLYNSSSTTPRYEIKSLFICIGSRQQSQPPYNQYNITWFRLDNKIRSATVNQNGTITFTDSDGNVIITAGEKLVTSSNQQISMGYDNGGFYFLFDDGQEAVNNGSN